MQMLFMVPVTLAMHDFWNEPDEDKRTIELVQFAKVRGLSPPSPRDACIS